MRRLLAGLSAALLVFAGALLFVGGRADADTTVQSGWWWKGNAGSSLPTPGGVPTVGLPTPAPTAPAPPNANGGLMISATADGPTAIAAVKASAGARTLTLKPASNGDVNGQGTHLVACAASGDWQPADGGAWDQRARSYCDGGTGAVSVTGVRGTDGTWTFPLSELSQQTPDVVIFPTADPAIPGGVLQPFQLVFEKPTPASFGVGETVPGDAGMAFSPSSSSETAPIDSGVAASVSAPSVDLGTPSINVPSSTAATPSVAAPATVATPRVSPNLAQPVTTRSQSNAARIWALVVVALAAAAAWWASRLPIPDARSLAHVAARRPAAPTRVDVQRGGLGRFTRLRAGAAPTLY